MDTTDLLDIDDFEMDELLTEFAEEEKKNTVVELSDSEEELDKLVEEFATALSDSDDNEKKSTAKVILSDSDDEIDNLLDDFNEDDDSVGSEQLKQEVGLQSSNKNIDCGTYDESKKSIIIIDSETQNDTVYDSSVEILVSEQSTPVKESISSNLMDCKTNEPKSVSSLNYSHNQEQNLEECTEDISKKASNTELIQNSFKESKGSYFQQSNTNFERTTQNENPQKEFSTSNICDNISDISHEKVYVPIQTIPTNKNLDTLVKSFIELDDLKKDPSPLSFTNVTILCDENILKPKNTDVNRILMSKIIEKAIDECMREKSKNSIDMNSSNETVEESINCNGNFDTNINNVKLQENLSVVLPIISNVVGPSCNNQEISKSILKLKNTDVNGIALSKIIEKAIDERMREESKNSIDMNSSNETVEESINCNGNFDTNMNNVKLQKNSSVVLPIISNVVGSSCNNQEISKSISSCISAQQKDPENSVKDEIVLLKDSAETENSPFSLGNLSVKPEGAINYGGADNSLKHLPNNSADDVKMKNLVLSDKKVFTLPADVFKSEKYLLSEENNFSLSKSVMTENIYKEQSNIPKIAVEIKIHISKDSYSNSSSSMISNPLHESGSIVQFPSDKTENTNSSSADVSIKLNGLADNFIVPITNVTDKNVISSRTSLHYNEISTNKCEFKRNLSSNSFHNEIISNTFELKEMKSRDSEGALNCTSSLEGLSKRKLEISGSEINVKKMKREDSNADNIDKKCDIPTFVLSEIHKALPPNSSKKINVSEKVLDYLVLQMFQKSVNLNFHKEVSEAEKLIKELEKKSESLSKTSNLLLTSYQELFSSQREAYLNSYKKKSFRTVGINVKIVNPKQQEKMPATENTPSTENESPRKDNRVSVIKKNNEAPSLVKKDQLVEEKKTPEQSRINLPVISNCEVSRSTKIVDSKNNSPVISNCEVSRSTKIVDSKNVSTHAPKSSAQEELPVFNSAKIGLPNAVKVSSHAPKSSAQEEIPVFNPAKIGPPNVVKSGSRLIPYFNPTKRFPHPATNSNSIVRNLLERPLSQHYESAQNGNTGGNGASPQLQIPKTSDSVVVPLNQLLQLRPPSRYDAPNVPIVSPFRTTAPCTMPTRTMNPATFAVSQNSSLRNVPTVSETLRNEIFRLPGAPPSVRTSSAANMLTKFASGIAQNTNQYPANFLQSSQSYLSQGPMVYGHSPPFHCPPPNHMQQSNMQMNSMHYFSNSAGDPLTAMNHLSSSLCHPTLSSSHSVTCVSPPPSIMTSAFYPQAASLMNNFNHNQFYPKTSSNHFFTSHTSIQHSQMTSRNVPVNTTSNSFLPSSRVTSANVSSAAVSSKSNTPSSVLSSKFSTPSPTVSPKLSTPPPAISPSVNSNLNVPPLPEEPSYNEPLPKPTLKVTKEGNDVILSWNVDLTNTSVTLSNYQIYSCHVNNAIEILPVWKKVGDVAALRLPMACRLRQFEKNNSYHFIIRIVDTFQKLGPFSNPASITF